MIPGARYYMSAKKSSSLPYDARVAYLESTGTQWIDTGITGRNGILTRVVGSLTDVDSINRFFHAYYSARIQFSAGVSASTVSNFTVLNMYGSGATTVQKDTDWHEFVGQSVSGDCWAKIDGVTVLSASTIIDVDVGIIYLFQASSTTYSRCKISAFSVRDTTTNQLIQDLIPVRKNGVGYMYDRVTGTLLGNSGTGDFGYGADVPFDDEVEYIERDCTIGWAGESGSLSGFRLDEYTLSNETCSNTTRRMDVVCSRTGDNTLFIAWLGSSFTAFSQCLGVWATTSGLRIRFNTSSTLTNTTTADFHACSIVPDGNGNAEIFCNGTSLGTSTSTKTSALIYLGLLYKYTASPQGKFSIKRFRLGSDVYLIPVKKGSQVGFYNMVDGHVFLEEQACLSAGPVV